MRITVRDLLFAQQRAMRLQDLVDDGIRLPDRFADDLFGKPASRAFGVIEAPGRIDRAIDGQPVLDADFEILLTVAGSGVDRAGALLQRDVIAENAERIAIQKRMPEDRAFELRPWKARRSPSESSQPSFSAVTFSSSSATI